MDKADKIKALELELHGIEVELREKLLVHRSLTVAIDYLENQAHQLRDRLASERGGYEA